MEERQIKAQLLEANEENLLILKTKENISKSSDSNNLSELDLVNIQKLSETTNRDYAECKKYYIQSNKSLNVAMNKLLEVQNTNITLGQYSNMTKQVKNDENKIKKRTHYSIEFILETCAKKLNKNVEDSFIQESIAKFKDEWITTEKELRSMTDEQLKEFGLKIALLNEIKQWLNDNKI